MLEQSAYGSWPMQYADIEGNVREAQPGLTGKCRDCGHPMVAKCGQHRVWHWAHWKSKDCDPWWEPETEWHRSWKNQFPVAWQEIGHTAQSGERHRMNGDRRRRRGRPINLPRHPTAASPWDDCLSGNIAASGLPNGQAGSTEAQSTVSGQFTIHTFELNRTDS